jgi:hypothetical protein
MTTPYLTAAPALAVSLDELDIPAAAQCMRGLAAEVERLRAALSGALENWPVPSSICKDRPAYEAARAALSAAPAQQAQVAPGMPDGWRLVEKKTHYQLNCLETNTVVATLCGPDAEENAAILARALSPAAPTQPALTDAQLIAIRDAHLTNDGFDMLACLRTVEAAARPLPYEAHAFAAQRFADGVALGVEQMTADLDAAKAEVARLSAQQAEPALTLHDVPGITVEALSDTIREASEESRQRREPEEAEPSRSERLRAAGYEPRDTRLTCEECGAKVTPQLLPVHKCEQAAPVAADWRDVMARLIKEATYGGPTIADPEAITLANKVIAEAPSLTVGERAEPVPLADGFDGWWARHRIKRVLNPAGVARMVWEASARHNRKTVLGATDSTSGFYPEDEGSTPSGQATASNRPAQGAAKPCLFGGDCKHGGWCSDVYCQERCQFKKAGSLRAIADLMQQADGGWNLPASATKRIAELLDGMLSTAQAPAAEPFWHAVVSKRAPVIDKAIRREDVASEYADKCRDNYPDATDIEVVPLYRRA